MDGIGRSCVAVRAVSFKAPLVRRAASVWRWLGREWRYRRDIEHLLRLDDTALADLGLRRGGIEGAVRGWIDPRK